MIKLIMTDMDGTLLDEKGELPIELGEIVPQLRDKGILFAAASGRQYYKLLDTFDEYKDEMLFLAENGTYVVYKGQELFSNGMSKETVEGILKIARNIPDTHILVSGKKKGYCEAPTTKFIDELELYYARYEVVEDFLSVDDDFLKIAIFDDKGAEHNSSHYFNAYRDQLQVSVSAKHWLDIMNRGANKGVAVKQIQEHFGFTGEETMVFGDYLNDLEMMSAAYYSYAMENAHPDVKKAARFMAKTNREHGVIQVIQGKVLDQLKK